MPPSRFQKFIYEKPRVEAFSDGVLAIVITLLVLEIKVPHTGELHTMRETFDALWHLRGEIIGWVISFLMVGLGWLQHHNVMHMCRKVDLAMIWINLFVLMAFCLIPFTSAFLGENPDNPAVVTVFALELAIGSLLLCWLYSYGTKHYLKEGYDPVKVRRHVMMAVVSAPLLYIVAALAAWINTGLAYGILILIPVAFIFPLDIEHHKPYSIEKRGDGMPPVHSAGKQPASEKSLPDYPDIE